MKALYPLVTVAFAWLAMLSPSFADKTVCDFEDGLPENWRLESSNGRSNPQAELETNGDNTVLELGKDAVMIMGDEQPLNFAIEGTLRREYDGSGGHVGFQFRNGYRAYLRKPGRVELSGPDRARGRGFSRNIATDKPTTFRIVVVGPTVRFFVNGEFEGQYDELQLQPGPLGLYQSGLQHNVYFDDITVNTELDPAQFLTVEPITGDDKALVFPPDQPVTLSVRMHNHADHAQEAVLGLQIATFSGETVVEKTMAPQSITADGDATVELALGAIPEGFYKLTFQPTGKVLPLAIQERGTVTHDQIEMPAVLTGVYWYYFGWQGLPEVWWNTYMHAASNNLRRHHFNTVICAIGMPTESIEILGQYGIRCFTRGEGPKGNVSHPNVIGGFIGDEPHKGQEDRYLKDYTRLTEKYPDKVWTTCMIGDGGVDQCQRWWDSWREATGSDNIVRMLRWYGIKKYNVGIKRTYGSLPPLTETLRDLSRGEGSYYLIMPSFGDDDNVEAYFSNPLPAQIKAMMHLAAAHQAEGLFFWTWQTPFPDHDAFVDPVTLVPVDGKWAAAGEAAGKILKNADLLGNATWGGRYREVIAPATLEVFELKRPDDPDRYLYAVNIDTEAPVAGTLYQIKAGAVLHDLFADQPLRIQQGELPTMRPDLTRKSLFTTIELGPGEGMLIRYAEPADGEGGTTAAPRVTYPPAVANASADKVTYLAELPPVEMPHPGWFPQVKFKGKTWYPDYHSNDLKLYSGLNDSGQLYEKSLWAHAETTIIYDLPAGAKTFAAAAGFGNADQKSSAIFRVIVDGEEKYNSGLMTIESGVQSVVVDLSGAKQLKLKTEEGGDGLYGDFTFWGEARLIHE